jgi:hypothetical protein
MPKRPAVRRVMVFIELRTGNESGSYDREATTSTCIPDRNSLSPLTSKTRDIDAVHY